MPNYSARLDRLEEEIDSNPVRSLWMNSGETQGEAAARHVEEHKLGVHPAIRIRAQMLGRE